MAAIKNSAISQGFVDPGSSTNAIGRYQAARLPIGRIQGYGQNFNIHLSSTKAKFSYVFQITTSDNNKIFIHTKLPIEFDRKLYQNVVQQA